MIRMMSNASGRGTHQQRRDCRSALAGWVGGLLVAVLSFQARADFTGDMQAIAREMAQALSLSPDRELSITALREDCGYMVSMEPLMRPLREALGPFVKAVQFHPFRSEEDALIRTLILTGGDAYAPVGLGQRRIDSLILVGFFYLFENQSDRVNYSFKVISLSGETRYESGEYTLNRSDCPPGLVRILFDPLQNPESAGELRYRGRLIGKLDDLFNSANSNLLLYPALYRFENRHPYALAWQVEAVKSLLSLKYGIAYSDTAAGRISIEPNGTLVFARSGQRRQIDRAVDGEPLLPDSFPEGYDSLKYLYGSVRGEDSSLKVESKSYTTAQEKAIRDRIHQTFAQAYPRLFDPFDRERLSRLFVDKGHPSILVGRKGAELPGRESISYAWLSPQAWLDALDAAAQQRGRRFAVKASVMAIFADNLDPHRYWAVVLQRWRTLDGLGNTVYADEGFLLVNFDFDGQAVLKEFRIHYRLWFNQYQYDDPERGLCRGDKLINDIDTYFVKGVHGIDASLKYAMRDFLRDKIKGAGHGVSARN
jgi:hypothetical protein